MDANSPFPFAVGPATRDRDADRSHPLFNSSLVGIRDTHCALDRDDCAPCPQLWFVRAGVFTKERGRKRVMGLPGHAYFLNQEEDYWSGHPMPAGVDMTILEFDSEVLQQALAPHDPAASQRCRPFALSHGPPDAPALLALQMLRRSLQRPDICQLQVEEASLLPLNRAIATSYGRDHHLARCDPPDGTRRNRDAQRVDAIRLMLAARPAHPHSLTELADQVHASPYHVARMFRRVAGLPIHRYLITLRLTQALERLSDYIGDLGALALDPGFASHSHFTTAFRAVFGMPPSAIARGLTAEHRLCLRKILEAPAGRGR